MAATAGWGNGEAGHGCRAVAPGGGVPGGLELQPPGIVVGVAAFFAM
jgi:hypothetical protein